MADTIVNTPASGSGSGAAGWFVAVVILLAVIAGGIYFYRMGGAPAPDAATINVTIPTPGTGGEGGGQ